MTDLYLHEEILLLALRDDEGTIAAGSMYAYSVAGAVLAELVVRGRLELTGTEKKRFVEVTDRTPVGEPLLDEMLAKIVAAKRRGSLVTWVSRVAGARNMRDRLAEGLRRRGILRADEKEVLVFFKRRIWPTVNPEPERRIVERLRSAIFTDGPVDARTVVLLSLADRTKLLEMVFDRKELKRRRDRIDALVAGEAVGKAVAGAVEAVQAAATIAAIT